QELIRQITVRTVNLDAVEAGPQRPLRAGAKFLNDAGDLMQVEGARHREWGFAMLGVGMTFGCDSRRCKRRFAVRLQVDMRLPTDVPQLQENATALGMNRVGDAPPSGDLSVRVDAGRSGITVAADRDG